MTSLLLLRQNRGEQLYLIPLLKISVNIGTGVVAAITVVAVGMIFVFIYDIGLTSWRILQAKANKVTDRFVNNLEGDEK